MNKICIFLGLIFLLTGAYAGVSISPSDLNITSMYGGDTKDIILTLKNNDSWDNTAHIVVLTKDINNSTSGLDAYLSRNNIGLFGKQSVNITLTLHALLNIKPGVYNIKVFADGTGYQPDPASGGGSSGGGSWYYRPDTNIDNNIPDTNILVGNDRDIYGCIPSAGYSWCAVKNRCIRSWEESCTSLIDANIVYVDKNVDVLTIVEKPYIPIEWIAGFILVGCLICGGIIFIYFRLNKPKSN